MTPRSALHQSFSSEATTPSLVRRTLSSWLRERGVTEEHHDDLVLAVNEAVANVVDHAYRGREDAGAVEVDAELREEGDGQRWVTVIVTDHGVWRQARTRSGFRGRGLEMIRALTNWRHIERRDAGTRVTMARRVD